MVLYEQRYQSLNLIWASFWKKFCVRARCLVSCDCKVRNKGTFSLEKNSFRALNNFKLEFGELKIYQALLVISLRGRIHINN